MSKHLYRELPIKDKAYFILIGLSGSWLYDALYPHIEDADWCKKFVTEFEDNCGDGSKSWHGHAAQIQECIDDSYDDILKYKSKHGA